MDSSLIKEYAREMPEGCVIRQKPDFKKVLLSDEDLRTSEYKDTKGNSTIGVGHLIKSNEDFTGWGEQDFLDLADRDIEERLPQIRSLLPEFDTYSADLQERLFSSFYRGSLGGSPKTVEHINAGRYKEAAKEFLVNDEYIKSKKEGTGIAPRMERTAESLNSYADLRNIYSREIPEGFCPAEEGRRIIFDKTLDDAYQYQFMGIEIPTDRKEIVDKIIEVISGGMTIDEADNLKNDYLDRIKNAPRRVGKLGQAMYNQISRDIEDAKSFVTNPFKFLENRMSIEYAKSYVEEDKEILDDALGGIEDIATFVFKPIIARARGLGGFVLPEKDKTRLETAVSDALQDPGVGVYGERIAEKMVSGEEGLIGRVSKIIAAGTAGTALELATFNPKGVFQAIKNLPKLAQSSFKSRVLAEVKKDLPQLKESLRKARPDLPSNVINNMTEVDFALGAEYNTALGHYLKSKVRQVSRRRFLGDAGLAALPDPNIQKIVEAGKYIAEKSAIPAVPLAITEEGIFQKSYRNIVNKMKPIEYLSKDLVATGMDIPIAEDPKLLSRQYQGISRIIESTLTHSTHRIGKDGNIVITGEGLKPILNSFDNDLAIAEPNQKTRHEDLKDYLISRRYLEDLVVRKDVKVTQEQINKSMEDFSRIRNKYGDEISFLEDTARRLYSYQIKNLETLKDSGIISQKQFEGILSKNKHYVPFKRVIEDRGIEYIPVSKGRFARTKQPIKAIKGSKREVEDPIESIIENTINVLDRSHRNKVTRSIAALEELYPERIQSVDKFDKNTLTYFENGEKRYVKVSPDLYEAASGMGETALDPFIKILAAPAKWLRTGATITPEFMTRNFIRDQFTGAIQSSIGFRPFIDSAFGLADVIGKTNLYHEWLQSGSAYSGIVDTSRDSLGKAYRELIGSPKLLQKLNIITTLGDLSQVFEEATRVGLFRAAKRKGLSSLEAGFEAREGTLDFGVKGAKTKNITAVKAFLNAQIQAFDKFLRTYKTNPFGATAKAVGYITIPSLLLYLKNRQDPEYKELPRWQKDLFWNIHVKNTWVRIPKPFAFGQVFGSLPERFMEYVDENDPSAFEGIAGSIYESLSPVATPDVIIPTALSPIIENLTNYSFFREREIVPKYLEKRLPAERYSKYTSESAKAIGKATNISPSKIENLIRGYTGTSGQYAIETSDLLLNQIRKASGKEEAKKPKELADYPVVRGFVGRSPYGYRSESAKDFFKIFRKSEQVKNSYNAAKKEGNKQRQKEIDDKYKIERKAFSYLNKKKKQMSKLQKKVDIIVEKDIPTRQKAQEIRELEKEITSIAIKALDYMKDKKQGEQL